VRWSFPVVLLLSFRRFGEVLARLQWRGWHTLGIFERDWDIRDWVRMNDEVARDCLDDGTGHE